MTASFIGGLPAQGGPLVSADVRNNFLALDSRTNQAIVTTTVPASTTILVSAGVVYFADRIPIDLQAQSVDLGSVTTGVSSFTNLGYFKDVAIVLSLDFNTVTQRYEAFARFIEGPEKSSPLLQIELIPLSATDLPLAWMVVRNNGISLTTGQIQPIVIDAIQDCRNFIDVGGSTYYSATVGDRLVSVDSYGVVILDGYGNPVITGQTVGSFVGNIYDSYGNATGPIQQAIDSVSASGGGSIFIRKGLYEVSTPIVVPDNVQLIGEGYETTLQMVDVFEGPMLQVTGNKSQLSNMRLLGTLPNDAFVTKALIEFFNSDNCSVKDCFIESAVIGIECINSNSHLFTNNYFADNNVAITFVDSHKNVIGLNQFTNNILGIGESTGLYRDDAGNVFAANGSDNLTWNALSGNGQVLYDKVIDAGGLGDFTSVEGALNSSSPGTTFFVRNGLYNISTTINPKAGIKIIGETRDGVILSHSGNDLMVLTSATFGTYTVSGWSATTGKPSSSTGNGTISTTNNSFGVSCSQSIFTAAMIGLPIFIEGEQFSIASLNSSSSINLDRVWRGSTLSNLPFIIPSISNGTIHLENLTFRVSGGRGISIGGGYNHTLKNLSIQSTADLSVSLFEIIAPTPNTLVEGVNIERGVCNLTGLYNCRFQDVNIRNLYGNNGATNAGLLLGSFSSAPHYLCQYRIGEIVGSGQYGVLFTDTGTVATSYRCFFQFDLISGHNRSAFTAQSSTSDENTLIFGTVVNNAFAGFPTIDAGGAGTFGTGMGLRNNFTLNMIRGNGGVGFSGNNNGPNTINGGYVQTLAGVGNYVIGALNHGGAAILTTTGNISTASDQLTSLASTTGLVAGQYITGTGIPINTFISSILGSTITMSQKATATTTGVSVVFSGILGAQPARYSAFHVVGD